MRRFRPIASAAIVLVIALCPITKGEETAFEYPCCLVEAYDPEDDGWAGMDDQWVWPVGVDPYDHLTGSPPTAFSAVTMPPDHWVELQFSGPILDGFGHDIIIIEIGRRGEQALVFLTDGAGQEYLLDRVSALDTGGQEPSEIRLDIARADLPFEPRAIRILAIDRFGDAPGFDLANVRARIRSVCGEAACNPCPVDKAGNVRTDTTLTWTPGSSAGAHIVYFGTSLSDVDANAAPVAEPAQPQDPNSFEPAVLELGRRYYWRVDEVSAGSVVPGKIWTFTVTESLVLDDFESNDSYNVLSETWSARDGAYVYLSQKPGPVHKGYHALTLVYLYDLPFRSEAIRALGSGWDFEAMGVKSLDLHFRGETWNDPSSVLFFSLGDGDVNTVVPYDGDPVDITSETWKLWRIDLSDVEDVNFKNVEYISIGLSDDGVSEPTGEDESIVYFDDITFYSRRCLPEYMPQADLTGDCSIDFFDIEEIAYTWLCRTPVFYPHESPGAPPLARYKFDGDALDSSGNGYHGVPVGDANVVHDDPVRGLVLSVDGWGDYVEIADAASLFSIIREAVTVTFWQRGADSAHHTDTICCSDYIYGVRDPAIAINLGTWLRPGRYNWDCGQPWSFDVGRLSSNHRYQSQWTDRWNHWAFTKDTQAGTDPNRGVMNIFLNGVLYDSRTDAGSPITGIKSFAIGTGWYGGYDGLIDNFHIFDYALSAAEIVHVATEGTGVFDLPLMLPADLMRDDQIDFADYAVLAEDWLDEYLWP